MKVVSFGTLAFLGMVNKQPIVRHSCVIVPFRHTFNTLECDENEWQEIKVAFIFCEAHPYSAKRAFLLY